MSDSNTPAPDAPSNTPAPDAPSNTPAPFDPLAAYTFTNAVDQATFLAAQDARITKLEFITGIA